MESVPFYLLRCARLYDLPFAIGCMVFVCRRFALLFDRTEQLARELDARVAERTKELTAETEARKSMMLNIFTTFAALSSPSAYGQRQRTHGE